MIHELKLAKGWKPVLAGTTQVRSSRRGVDAVVCVSQNLSFSSQGISETRSRSSIQPFYFACGETEVWRH